MRELEFRAWMPSEICEDTGDEYGAYMMHAEYGQYKRAEAVAIVNDDRLNNPCDMEIIWMQYTGLKDKNGKKIFEGDVVRFEGYYHKKNDVIGYIAFNEKNASFGIIKVGGLDKHILPLSYFNDNGCDSSFRGGIENSEVIGNVHETPELLESNNE